MADKSEDKKPLKTPADAEDTTKKDTLDELLADSDEPIIADPDVTEETDVPEELAEPEEADKPIESTDSAVSSRSAESNKTTDSSRTTKSSGGVTFKTPEEVAAEDATKATVAEELPTPVVMEHGHGFKHWIRTHKKTTVLLVIIIVLAALVAVPWTRYKIAALFWKQTQQITVLDTQTNQPVSEATVTLGGQTGHTDNKGNVSIKSKVGEQQLTVTKQNYKSASQTTTVPILKAKKAVSVSLQATGRQVTVMAENSLTGKPIENATFTVDKAHFKTNAKGQVSLVVPASSKQVEATITANGYGLTTGTILVNAQTLKIQSYKLTPSGKVYFLSNRSGKLDVVKSNLDGSDRQTVIAGTGKENNSETALLASQDWRYLALLSRRDGGEYAKLFLIDTQTDKMITMDEGAAYFGVTGWHNHTFIYTVNRAEKKNWEPGKNAIKSFNAETGKLATLDQSEVTGAQSNYGFMQFTSPYILNNEIVYGVNWYGDDAVVKDKLDSLRTVSDAGKNKKDIKTFPNSSASLELRAYEPNSVYVRFGQFQSGKTVYEFYEYENGSIKTVDGVDDNSFYTRVYPTYLASPSNKQTFWAEARDGKNALFVGDAEGKNGKQIASLSEYNAYGWYTDDYLLVSKNGSELYAMSKDGTKVTKIADYYKVGIDFRGYGKGYGGL